MEAERFFTKSLRSHLPIGLERCHDTCYSNVPIGQWHCNLSAGGGRVINLNSGAGTAERAELSAYTASKSALARITGSTHLAGWVLGIRAFDLSPGVVRTRMTLSMDLHRDRTQWTEPADVANLALALASGDLDAWSGRFVRAGVDTPASLRERAALGLDDAARTLRLRPWGSSDPLG